MFPGHGNSRVSFIAAVLHANGTPLDFLGGKEAATKELEIYEHVSVDLPTISVGAVLATCPHAALIESDSSGTTLARVTQAVERRCGPLLQVLPATATTTVRNEVQDAKLLQAQLADPQEGPPAAAAAGGPAAAPQSSSLLRCSLFLRVPSMGPSVTTVQR